MWFVQLQFCSYKDSENQVHVDVDCIIIRSYILSCSCRQLQQTDEELDTTNKKIKESVEEVQTQLHDLKRHMDTVTDMQRAYGTDLKNVVKNKEDTIAMMDIALSAPKKEERSLSDPFVPVPPNIGRPSVLPKRTNVKKQVC